MQTFSNFSFGICSFEANQIRALDTQIYTCEMYRREECNIPFFHLGSHMKNKYDNH